MKKVSANVFFTVLWSGVCQVVGWFFGLFGYKRSCGHDATIQGYRGNWSRPVPLHIDELRQGDC